jgi:hypothetical protein
MRITGTFIDEITVDIPSNNWSAQHWSMDFRAMKHIGIDTVIIIRSGYQNKCIFESQALKKHVGLMMPVFEDLLELFLCLAQENGMDLYFGTYDDYEMQHSGNHKKLIQINKDFIDEAWSRYGSYDSFKGWYVTQELATKDEHGAECIRDVALHCKSITGEDMPVLISPFIAGRKQFDNPITLEQHENQWDYMLSVMQGAVDIVAFQDGNVDYHELPEYIAANKKLLDKYGMHSWSNLETFDRDMPYLRFPPTDWRKLWWKLDAAEKTEVEKIITFEFSSFMSPYSCWPSAHNLYDRYCDYFGIERLPRETETAPGKVRPENASKNRQFTASGVSN